MDNRENQNPSTGSESDVSKSQSQQQPTAGQDRQQQPNAEQSRDEAATGQQQSGQSTDQAGQSSTAQSGFGETATQQRSDVEGSSIDQQPTSEPESGFVGSEGQADTSSELVEDEDQDFGKDGQGAPEGK